MIVSEKLLVAAAAVQIGYTTAKPRSRPNQRLLSTSEVLKSLVVLPKIISFIQYLLYIQFLDTISITSGQLSRLDVGTGEIHKE